VEDGQWERRKKKEGGRYHRCHEDATPTNALIRVPSKESTVKKMGQGKQSDNEW
jgi:hypothetical protein